jgi:D-inositol-3-phosphate glycosyltransferase
VKGRLLWIGDAVVPTGFSTVTHAMLQHLLADWEVIVSGVNYEGQRHRHPYRIVSARQGRNGDMWGLNNFRNVCAEFAPDVVAINTDWWNVANFLQRAPKDLPIVGYMPVDGANLDPAILPQLSSLASAVWYTDFGHRQAVKAGFRGARKIIPHGIDTSQWSPVDRALARDLLDLPVPEGAFIVGNVNRNQPRKRLDVTIQFFAEWVRARKLRNAWLLLHCARQDIGWDLMQLAKHYGVADRLILTGGDSMHQAVEASRLQLIYSALDVQVSTTLGEGWGLTTMEGMACGVPQIVPDWAALGEWPLPAVKVRCTTQLTHPGLNTIGALPDKEAFIAALDRLHRDTAQRAKLSRECLAFVRQPQFAWTEVARQMSDVLELALQKGARRSTLQRV